LRSISSISLKYIAIDECPDQFWAVEAKKVMESAVTSPVRWTTENLAMFEGDRVNRYEIIDGELFVTRAPNWKHQAICINIGTVLKLWSDESGLGQTAINPGIVLSESDNVIPDVVWASNELLEFNLMQPSQLTGTTKGNALLLEKGDR
jgi:hypothetical protein